MDDRDRHMDMTMKVGSYKFRQFSSDRFYMLCSVPIEEPWATISFRICVQ